jgi:HSP20 family protein
MPKSGDIAMSFRFDPFREFWNEVGRVSGELNRTFHNRMSLTNPSANVWSDEDHVFAEFDLPGLDPAKIDVTVAEGNTLQIQGTRDLPKTDGAVWVRQERPTGSFTREIELPVVVDADRVQAKYENGVLKLTLPKSAAAKPRKIPVA